MTHMHWLPAVHVKVHPAAKCTRLISASSITIRTWELLATDAGVSVDKVYLPYTHCAGTVCLVTTCCTLAVHTRAAASADVCGHARRQLHSSCTFGAPLNVPTCSPEDLAAAGPRSHQACRLPCVLLCLPALFGFAPSRLHCGVPGLLVQPGAFGGGVLCYPAGCQEHVPSHISRACAAGFAAVPCVLDGEAWGGTMHGVPALLIAVA